MKTILIGRGHLGMFLKSRLGIPDEFLYTGQLIDFPEFIKDHSNVDVVINTAGKTDLKWCEENAREAAFCNIESTLKAFRAVDKYTLFVQLSSGCVWDGPFPPIGLAFQPTMPPSPASFYSWTKAACDALMLDESVERHVAILRPRQVYSPLPSARNTFTKLRTYARLIDTQNSMTSAETIARTIEKLASCPRHCFDGRIINVYEKGISSPYKVGCLLAEAGLREMPVRLEKSELDVSLRPKRVDTVLFDWWFEDLVCPPEVEDELRRVIGEYKKNLV